MTASSESGDSDSLFDNLGGEVGRRARSLDWAQTPLGAPQDWPQALRHAARLVLHSSLPMTLAWGPELIQVYNEAYLQILGDKHPAALGQPVEQVYAEIWDQIGPILRRVYETGEAVGFEDMYLPIARKGFAEEMYFTFSYSPVYDDAGQVGGLLSSAVETTHSVLTRRRSEVLRRLAAVSSRVTLPELIAATRECLDEASDDLPVCMLWLADSQRRDVELLASTGVREETVPSHETVRSWIPWERLGPDFGFLELPETAVEALALEDGRPGVSRVRLLPVCESHDDREGCVFFLAVGVSERLPFDASYREFLVDLGRELGRKVADLRYHELKLIEAERRYQAVFEHSIDAMFLVAPDGRTLAANPAACEMLGYTEDELCKLRREDIVDMSDPRLAEFVATGRATGRAHGAIEFIHRSGLKIPCEVSGREYRDPRGKKRVSLIARDIRRRLELESNLRQAQKLEVVGKLAGGIAHDFNNLLTVIRSSAQLLEMEIDPGSEMAEDVQIIQAASDRASAMTRRLLAFSRRQPIRKTDLDLAAVISQLDKVLRSLIGASIDLVTDIEEEPWTVRADQQAIEQILLNLTVNARDAMPNGGRISISLSNLALEEPRHCVVGAGVPRGRYVSLAVTDTGSGIPDEVGVQVFEPFYTTKKSGTGLGLATVADVTLECGGHILMESEEGVGTTFEVLLPVSSIARPSDAGKDAASAPKALPQVRVLLAEDQPLVRRVTTRILETAGIAVTAVASGREAIARITAAGPRAFDLVLSDVVMPDISGEEVARRVCEIDAGIKVLFLSGYADRSYLRVEPGREVNLLMKPFTGEELVEAVCHSLQDESI